MEINRNIPKELAGEADKLLDDTQATALAYEREVKAKERRKCIEEIEILMVAHDPRLCVPGNEYFKTAIQTLRASKGE